LTIHERGINIYLIVIILVFGGVRVAQLLVFCFVFCLPSSCVLCTQCCQFLWIVHSWLPLQFYLMFIECRNIKSTFSCYKYDYWGDALSYL